MIRRTQRLAITAVLVITAVFAYQGPAGAQMITGTISGRVVDSAGLGVPGVSVTARSPVMQGARTAVTTDTGAYTFPQLQPGEYTLSFELSGFATAAHVRTVATAQTVSLDVTLNPAGIEEAVTVTGRTDAFTNTVQGATNLRQELLSELPTTRTLLAAVNLAPSVHATGPSGNVTIAGAMSFENAFMLNGVQIQDNLRGTPFNLFIEDAIQETTIVTSGISAEYGRFAGGVVNAITKSGGNQFSGSFRTTFNNDNWRTVTPFDEPKSDVVVPTYEFTLGGPILPDRTWFFAAGRLFESTASRQTIYTRNGYEFVDSERRFEGKLTQALGRGQTARATYADVRREQQNNAFGQVMDFESLHTRQLPQQLLALHYTGTVGSSLFLEGQFSSRSFKFENSGSQFTDIIRGTMIVDGPTGARYWSPTFCGACGPEERSNDNVAVKATYFWSTGLGAHNFVAGYDTFNDIRLANNHQTGSDFRISATTSIIRDGQVYPVMRPDRSAAVIWNPILEGSRGTDFRTHSVFVNDTWSMNRHLTASLGLRWDRNRGKDSADQLTADDAAFSPRLGLVWDPTGTGRWSLNASYAKYVGAIANTMGDAGSAAGNPAGFGWYYLGPAINADAGAPLVPTDEALRRIFDWFESAGGTNMTPVSVSIPGVATRIGGSLRSPHANEVAGGFSRSLGTRGALRADVVYRDYNDFYANRTDRSTGTVSSTIGLPRVFDLTLVENTDAVERRYASLSMQATYRAADWVDLGGNYTLSRLWGTVVGENITSGPVRTSVLSYPEYFDVSWSNPEGDLSADQRHRMRAWATVRLPFMERVARTTLGVVQQVQSGTPYGAIGSVRTGGIVGDLGYRTPPTSVTYYFTGRDAFQTERMSRTDLSLNMSRRLPWAARGELFLQAQLLNAFNQFQLYDLSGNAINTTVLTAVDDPATYQAFNPFTEQPVRGVHWEYGEQFGEATGAGAYTLPRTFQFSVGFRF
jgi:hypothetical protein